MAMSEVPTSVPVKMYKSARRVTVAAAMPGLESKNIKVSLSIEGELVLRADERGAFKGANEVILDEWNPGAYRRTVPLGTPVDAPNAVASYANGILVVSLPIVETNQPGDVSLERRANGRE